MNSWIAKLQETFLEQQRYKLLLGGLKNTVIITLGALLIGVLIGSAIAVIKYLSEDNKKLKPLSWLCDLYVTIIRGVPVVVLLLIFYFVIMASVKWEILVCIVTFGINSGAYMAEVIRSGIRAIDDGQMEAGRSLGFSRWQTMLLVILPQAIKNILPAIGNEMIALLKETAVAGYVAVVDLTRAGDLVRNNSFDAVNPLMVVAVVYLIMVIGLTRLLSYVEKKMHRGDRKSV